MITLVRSTIAGMRSIFCTALPNWSLWIAAMAFSAMNDIAVTSSTAYALEQIAVPTLIIHGTADRMVPYEQHARPLATRISGAELLTIEGGEHVSIFTHRAEVLPRVARFLREHST